MLLFIIQLLSVVISQGLAVTLSPGTTTVLKLNSYSQNVAFIVPSTYQKTEKINLVLFLHGDNSDNNPIDFYLKKFDLANALDISGRNAIMIFPLSFAGPHSRTEDYLQYL